jgi:hypothetical protein
MSLGAQNKLDLPSPVMTRVALGSVVTVQKVAIAVALALGRGWDDGDAIGAQRDGEAGAAGGVDCVCNCGHMFTVTVFTLTD